MLIAIDTATKYLGLALYHEDALIAEQMWRTGNKHNLMLAPSIEHMMAMCDVTASDLTMVAVTNGPGSYTGLRIGVALAKGLAMVNNLPLIGVSTLDITAAGQTFSNTKHRLLCVLPAGRSRIISGEYQVKKGRWIASSEAKISTWEECFESLESPSYYVAGEIDESGLEALANYENPEISLNLIDAGQRMRRTAILAQEAWRRYHDGEPHDFLATKLAPVYMNAPG